MQEITNSLNYLAHIYLSGDDEQLLFGNFIADHVKGNVLDLYETGIQKGIRLHRMIDTYTDTHAIVRQGKVRLRPYVGKYAPVALDILYDHFLAAGWNDYHYLPLESFTFNTYTTLDKRVAMMPEKTKHMYTYMRRDDWLSGYAQIAGIDMALKGLSRRTKFESNLGNATVALRDHYNDFKKEFEEFFSELKLYISNQKKS